MGYRLILSLEIALLEITKVEENYEVWKIKNNSHKKNGRKSE